jgi:hypothetical protein
MGVPNHKDCLTRLSTLFSGLVRVEVLASRVLNGLFEPAIRAIARLVASYAVDVGLQRIWPERGYPLSTPHDTARAAG